MYTQVARDKSSLGLFVSWSSKTQNSCSRVDGDLTMWPQSEHSLWDSKKQPSPDCAPQRLQNSLSLESHLAVRGEWSKVWLSTAVSL